MFRNRHYQLHLDVLLSLISFLKLERFTTDQSIKQKLFAKYFAGHEEATRLAQDANVMLGMPLCTKRMEELL